MASPGKTRLGVVDITIANGASLSSGTFLGNGVVVGILLPSAWTTADLTFQASLDNTTFADMYNDDDTEYTVQAAASRFVPVKATTWAGVMFVKVRSGTSGAAVNQGGARTIKLSVRLIE